MTGLFLLFELRKLKGQAEEMTALKKDSEAMT
jgi:hypothetical protein